MAPSPGGITFIQTLDIIHGLFRKGRVLGLDFVEMTPARDLNEITSIVAGRIIVNFIGSAVRAGYFD